MALRILPLLVFGSAILFLLVKSDDPRIRFAGVEAQPLFQPIHQVDIAFMGTSRMRRAIYTPFIESALANQESKPVIWDVAFPGTGMGAEIVYLEALIERHQVRKVYMHYYHTSGQKKIHRHFAKFATYQDLLFGPLPEYNLASRWQIRTSMMAEKLDHTLIQLLSAAPDSEHVPPDRLYDDSLPRYIKAEGHAITNKMLKKARAEFRAWKPDKGWHARNRYYLKRFLRKARALNIEVVFLDLPKVYMKPLSDKHMENVRREFDTEYISAFAVIDKATDYGDRGHLNIRGALKIGPLILESR